MWKRSTLSWDLFIGYFDLPVNYFEPYCFYLDIIYYANINIFSTLKLISIPYVKMFAAKQSTSIPATITSLDIYLRYRKQWSSLYSYYKLMRHIWLICHYTSLLFPCLALYIFHHRLSQMINNYYYKFELLQSTCNDIDTPRHLPSNDIYPAPH